MGEKYKYLAILIIAAAVVLAITSAWNDSIIVDEIPHIGAGYSYLEKQDMRLNPEHPPLAKDLAAVPLIFLNLNNSAFNTKFWQEDVNGQWEFGRYLIFESGNNADTIRHLAKLPEILFFILAAIILFTWSSRRYGGKGGIIALILFCFSTTIIAHARFVTTDVPALFGILAAIYFFIRYLKHPTTKNLVISSLIFGIALITKFNTFLLVPFLGLLALVHGYVTANSGFKNRIIKAIKFGFISVFIFAIGFAVIVWPVYYFHTYNYQPERQHSDTQFLLSSYGNRLFANPVVWMSDKPVIRSAGQYLLGLLMVVQRSTGGNTTYFLGQVSGGGWHYYFPIVYFIKETLAWWGLVLIAIISLIWKRKKPAVGASSGGHFLTKYFDEFAMLLWLVVYWATSIQSNLNIGVRHLLPTYPFAIMLVSGQITKLWDYAKKQAGEISKRTNASVAIPILIALLLGWYVEENLGVYPYYLTYFNQVVGGSSGGYRYVVDSNLDWGQDLIRLSNWVKENNIPKIEVDYFGWADPAYYLKDHYIWMNSTKYTGPQDFINRNQSNGWMAISATFLEGSEGTPDKPNPTNYLWVKFNQPVIVIGNSIFVYHIQ